MDGEVYSLIRKKQYLCKGDKRDEHLTNQISDIHPENEFVDFLILFNSYKSYNSTNKFIQVEVRKFSIN